MDEFGKYAGVAIIIFAVFAPFSYCIIQDEVSRDKVKIACIENGGDWSSAWGGSCEINRLTE